MTALHVVPDLGDHPLLCSSKREGKSFITFVESLTDAWHGDSPVLAATDIFLFQKRKLEIEEFLELESVSRLFQRYGVGGEMDVPECEMQRYKALLLHYIFRKCFFDFVETSVQRGFHQLVHHLAGYTAVLELFSAGVDSGHARTGTRLSCFCTVVRSYCIDFRMDNVDPAVESRRFAEENERKSGPEFLVHPFDALEERHLHFSAAVLHPHAHSLDGVVFHRGGRIGLH